MISVQIMKIPFKFQIDTGSSISVISEKFYLENFQKFQLQPPNNEIFSYNQFRITSLGFFRVKIFYRNRSNFIELHVIKNGGPPILGRDFLQLFSMGISQVNFLRLPNEVNLVLKKFSKVFAPELGTFNKGKIKINLHQNAIPKFFRPRPLPFALQRKVELELEKLLKLNIIEQVDYAEWGTPIVPVIKRDGSIRICGDFKVTLNDQLNIDKHPLPRIEDLFQKLQGGIHFSKLDLSNAYQQLVLTDESKQLVTISTHKGLYRYNRLPFGVACAPAKFQKIMESLLQGLDGVICFLDDILITGKTRDEHIQRLAAVLNILKNAGLRVKKSVHFSKRKLII